MDSFSKHLIVQFISAAAMNKAERAVKNIDIDKVYGLLKQQFDRKLYGVELFNEGKEQLERNAKFELTFVNGALEGLKPYKSEERKLLLEYRDYIVEKAELDIVKQEFPQIFRSERAYNFFIRALKSFNAIDEKHTVLRGGQKIMNAIRKSSLYKKHILFQPLTLKSYVEELNKLFGSNMCVTNLTDEDYNQKIEVEDYLKENYEF
ncbi:hypothetical protein [Polaribacter porphyrae]|uniref:Uncharacterized protein n=1 Tax=Polaribacter porphyrae TaxID=1137780 RepID=A0A2S7WP93_9FLAO|nr:hypothetical protein [Polaribacter porphyrae]PQJ79403.1 hypothetical protein BTO18_09560 [Polaribacter porphyrae]